MGPLIPLFWTSGDIYPGFQKQRGFLAYVLHRLHATESSDTSGATPADLLAVSMVVVTKSFTTRMHSSRMRTVRCSGRRGLGGMSA